MNARTPGYFFVAAALAGLFLHVLALPAHADASKPWALRNLYKIPIERGVLVYAEDNAEWRVLMDDGQVLADRIGFSVELADGAAFKGIELEDGVSGRERFSSPLGDGIVYSVTFPPRDGLRVVHELRTFNARPFVFVEIKVENVGMADKQIAAIRPVIAQTSVMQAMSPQASVRHRRMLSVAGHPVAAPRQDATMAVIHDPAKPISFGVGLIPRGAARGVVQFQESGGEWHGDISCHFEPYKTIKPGESVSSDPLWISHGVAEPRRVDLNYSWVYSTMVSAPDRKFAARGWYTLEDSAGLDAYVGAAGDWKAAGVDHVLLGRGWEGRPGSLEGAAGRFPKSMKQAVGALSQAGLTPGVTIDPLAISKGDAAWSATSSDGLVWLNPQKLEGLQALAQKVQEVKAWGVGFVVVGFTAAPDEVLGAFGLTRAEAQNLAFTALREAASPIPVFPSSISTVSDELDQWLDASSAVACMAVYGMDPGPLNYTVNGNSRITPELLAAAQFWPGPIEFRGVPARKLQGDLLGLVRQEVVAGQPVDAEKDAPRTWLVQKHDAAGALLEERTVAVGGGAEASPAARAEAEGTGESAS